MPKEQRRRVRSAPAKARAEGQRTLEAKRAQSTSHKQPATSDSKASVREQASQETLFTRTFAAGEHPAHVRVATGGTYNLLDFNSLRLDVEVTIPCLASEVDEAFDEAAEFCREKMLDLETEWMGKR